MKVATLASLLLLCCMPPCRAEAANERIEKLHQSFRTRIDERKVERMEGQKKLDDGYLRALDRLLEKAKSTGKLDAVIPIQAEIDAVKAGTEPLPDMGVNTSYEVKKLRGKYEEARRKTQRSYATAVAGLADRMERSLVALETEFTKAGQLDGALSAKTLRAGVIADPTIKEARDSLKFGLSAGTRPALVLRREGDNLEVLVHYDSRGKVSMQSAVENVRESTGKGGELGNSKAKVLGEFVGATGFEVDSFVAYNQVFDNKDVGGLVLTEILSELRHQEEGKRGLRLTLDPGGKNPHVNCGALLPPEAQLGTFHITCRYFIPKANRALSGIQFVHGVGGPIGGGILEKTGKWETAEIVSKSLHASPTLLLYLNLAEGKNRGDAEDEYVVLRSLKVEHVKFSAMIQKKYGEHGEVVETINDPAKQSCFVTNGELAKD